MAALTIACPACRAAGEVAAETAAHQCAYCGHSFYVAATEAGKAAITAATNAKLEPIREQIDNYREQALAAQAAGRRADAEALMRRHVEGFAHVYRETGYYGLMGLGDVDAIATYERQWLAGELASLEPSQDAGTADDHARYTAAITAQNLDELLAVLPSWARARLRGDEPDPELAIHRCIEATLWQLPWVSNAKLRKLGVSLAEPRIDVMGAWTVPCGNCAAPLPVEPLVESIECAHCGASSRLRLDGVNRYRAHGLTEDQARTQIALERAVATRDVGAALEAVSATAAQLAPHGTPAHRQLVFSNARMQFAWLEGAGELDAASRLGLGPPTQCKTCDSRVALAPEGAGNCPVCQQPV